MATGKQPESVIREWHPGESVGKDGFGNLVASPKAKPIDIVQEYTYQDFTIAEGSSGWIGRAPYMTIEVGWIVLGCTIVVLEEFDDSADINEVQVTNDPDGAGTQLSNFPNPKDMGVADHISNFSTGNPIPDPTSCWTPDPDYGAITPVVAMAAWNGDGTKGRCVVITRLLKP